MARTIGFWATDHDEQLLRALMRPGDTAADVIRRALHLLHGNAEGPARTSRPDRPFAYSPAEPAQPAAALGAVPQQPS